MKLRKYEDDPLVKLLNELSAAATPGQWEAEPRRLYINGQLGPVMSYLVGNQAASEGMKVSLGSERHADHHLVAALVNAWRDDRLTVILEG